LQTAKLSMKGYKFFSAKVPRIVGSVAEN